MNIDKVFKYHAPKGDQPLRYERIRSAAKNFAKILVECCPDSEDRKRAIQKVRIAVMLANASIAINESDDK